MARSIRTASNDAGPLIVLAANESRNIANYRPGLVRALKEAGFRVTIFAGDDRRAADLEQLGADLRIVPMASRGTSLIADLRTLRAYIRELRRFRPAAFLGFTVKPNIYGSIAADRLGIPVINNISGLGMVFARQSLLRRFVSFMYKRALNRSATVFFQNQDDLTQFSRLGLVKKGQTRLLPGSGIDLSRFAPRKRRKGEPFTFLFAARLLWDKGVGEYVEAARRIRARRSDVRFIVLGIIEPAGRSAVPESQLRAWEEEGAISYLGAADDVRDAFAEADCLILPTYYREGVPRVILEASAMAIPVITCDVPGCRDAVEDGATGFCCRPRDVASLVAAIERMIDLPPTERRALGRSGRAKMEREFGEDIVHRSYLDALARLGIQGATN